MCQMCMLYCDSAHNTIWLNLTILVYVTASDVKIGRELSKHTPHPHKECYSYLPPTVALPRKQVGYQRVGRLSM